MARQVTGWSRRFEDPIRLPDGRELVTLQDAADYVIGLPARVSAEEHWQIAMRHLIWCADEGGIMMTADIAMRQALAGGSRSSSPKPVPRRKAAKTYNIVPAAPRRR